MAKKGEEHVLGRRDTVCKGYVVGGKNGEYEELIKDPNV